MHKFIGDNCQNFSFAKSMTANECSYLDTEKWTDVLIKSRLYGNIQCTTSEDFPVQGAYGVYRHGFDYLWTHL